MNMQDALVPEELWQMIEPLIPPPLTRSGRGRPRVSDRACLAGIIFVLQSGCPWRLLPAKELGCGSAATCFRRFQLWTNTGVWIRLHLKMLAWLSALGQVDPRHVIIDSASTRAFFGGDTPASMRRIAGKTAVNAR
jgi:transposase